MRNTRALQPLEEALKLQRAAAKEGFDWRHLSEMYPKLAEEMAELRAARTPKHRHEELGDLFFMLVNLARHLKLDPRTALAAANRKFMRRYAFIRKHEASLPPLSDPRRLDAMEALWQKAKRKERRR